MTERTCFRCDAALERPIDRHAFYVTGEDTVEVEALPKIVCVRHTERTKLIRDQLREEHGLTVSQANMAISRKDESLVPRDAQGLTFEDFDLEEVRTPVDPSEDPDVVQNVEIPREVETDKPRLVCPDCLRESDEVIWGPAGE